MFICAQSYINKIRRSTCVKPYSPESEKKHNNEQRVRILSIRCMYIYSKNVQNLTEQRVCSIYYYQYFTETFVIYHSSSRTVCVLLNIVGRYITYIYTYQLATTNGLTVFFRPTDRNATVNKQLIFHLSDRIHIAHNCLFRLHCHSILVPQSQINKIIIIQFVVIFTGECKKQSTYIYKSIYIYNIS